MNKKVNQWDGEIGDGRLVLAMLADAAHLIENNAPADIRDGLLQHLRCARAIILEESMEDCKKRRILP